MNFHRIKLFVLAVVALFAISCKCTKYGCQIPCSYKEKEVKYFFGAYYDPQGKVIYRLYVSDSIYSAKAQADFDAFKGAILSNKIN